MRTLKVLIAGFELPPEALHADQTHIKARAERHKHGQVTIYVTFMSLCLALAPSSSWSCSPIRTAHVQLPQTT